MAERVGFEPTVPHKRYACFQDRYLQPLGHLSILLLIKHQNLTFMACIIMFFLKNI